MSRAITRWVMTASLSAARVSTSRPPLRTDTLQAHALLDGQRPGADRLDGVARPGQRVVGHEAQAAQVDPEQRDAVVGHQAGAEQKGPVATQHHEHVDGSAELGGGKHLREGMHPRIFGRDDDRVAPPKQPLGEVGPYLQGLWLSPL